MQQTREIEFSILRGAYKTIRAFVENETDIDGIDLSTNLQEDLFLYGDDSLDFLEKFVSHFSLDTEGFQYEKYFYTEADFFNISDLFISILELLCWVPLKTFQFLSSNKFRVDKPRFGRVDVRMGLSFRDLLSWYIEGKFISNATIRYSIKRN